ncbi:hypothetical protein B0H14DRAFT_3888046 [Mycena olivaceomarginata]|nr:hypothetical protein B0H14DRAFT_3888046 [Mycena olivaceomarginata]
MSSGGPQSLAVSLGYIRASWYGWSSFNDFRSPLRPLVPAHYCEPLRKLFWGSATAVPSSTAPVATRSLPPARAAHSARPRAGPGGLQVSETFLETLYMRPARAHPPPPLRRFCACCPAPRRAWRTCARLAGSIFDPLALAAPPPPRIAHLRAHRWVHFCTPIDFRDATQAPRTRSTSPRRCCVDPSRFSGPPSLRIVYPHVSRHMWHAPVRRPPLLRSQPPLARPLRVPTVAPIQRTLARPDPWN